MEPNEADKALIKKHPELFEIAKLYWRTHKTEIFNDPKNAHLRRANSHPKEADRTVDG